MMFKGKEEDGPCCFPGYFYSTTHQIPPYGRDDKQPGLLVTTIPTAERLFKVLRGNPKDHKDLRSLYSFFVEFV